MEKPTKIINKSQLQNGLGLKGPIGSLAASLLMSILEINKLNRDYEKVCQYEGPEFSKKVLELYGITVVVPEEDLKNLPEGQIVTISNHAFGGADGLIISSIVGALKPDYKILTNFILSLIPALKSSFMPVNPFKGGDVNKSSFAGIKVALQHIKNGGSLGLFPAGAVSTWQKKKDRTAIRKGCRPIPEDCPWSPNMAKLIMTANAPVVPIYFDGGNSFSMHVLGRIYHFLRTGRLIHELRNKRGKTLRLRIGKPIMPEEMAKFPDGKSLINYLRNRVYCLEATLKPKEEPKFPLTARREKPLVQSVPKEKVEAEIATLEGKKLFENGKYICYVADSADIPVCMQEIGRLREETFRAIGEGTGKASDIDKYDAWYKQMFLWDKENSAIAGAYRIGVGPEIYPAHGGIKAFYSPSLVKVGPKADEILPVSIEMGRSFVSKEYQKDSTTLSLLLKGLLLFSAKQEKARFCIGPASISGSYPLFYRSLIYSYLIKYFRLPEGDSFIKPVHPFKPDWLRVNPDQLLGGRELTLEEFNTLLDDISYGQYSLPALIRFYFANNAKVADFNVDPDFNDSMDAMIVTDLNNLSPRVLALLMRNMKEEDAQMVRSRFAKSFSKENG